MSSVRKVLSRGITLLLMWRMPHALTGTETQDQKSIRDHVCSVLRRENGLFTRQDMGRPLEDKRRKAQCDKEKP